MKIQSLGAKGPPVSRIGFGAWAIGGVDWGPSDAGQSRLALRKALELGVTFLDTADVYGFGCSEKLIAEVAADFGREGLTIATKAGNDFYHGTAQDDVGYGPIKLNETRDYLIFAAEQSLRRLRCETLDILQLHSLRTSQLESDEPWEALLTLKESGKIRWAGWSVTSYRETEQARFLDLHHDLLDCVQVRYNLLERSAEEVFLPRARHYGLGVIVRIPLLFGLLTGKFYRQTRFPADDHRRFNLSPERLEAYLGQMEDLETLFESFPSQSRAQVSLRFCLSHPACHTVIPGGRNPGQVEENCRAADLGPLPAELIAGLPPR